MIASTENKLRPLRIAWQQDTPFNKKFSPISQKHTPNKNGKQADKSIELDDQFQNCKMPDQPIGYIKSPRYDFF